MFVIFVCYDICEDLVNASQQSFHSQCWGPIFLQFDYAYFSGLRNTGMPDFVHKLHDGWLKWVLGWGQHIYLVYTTIVQSALWLHIANPMRDITFHHLDCHSLLIRQLQLSHPILFCYCVRIICSSVYAFPIFFYYNYHTPTHTHTHTSILFILVASSTTMAKYRCIQRRILTNSAHNFQVSCLNKSFANYYIYIMDAQNQEHGTQPKTETVELQKQTQQSHQNQQHQQKKPVGVASIKQTRKYQVLQKLQMYFDTEIKNKLNQCFYNTYSIIEPTDPDRLKFVPIFKEIYANIVEFKVELLGLDPKLQRGVACFLGLAICDALGASTQFIHFDKERRDLIAYDFEDVIKQIKERVLNPRSGKIGIWTDDCSMALCMADSLLLNHYSFNAKHMRYMFHMWLEHGLNNGGRPYSIGLGGNISISMSQFVRKREQYTQQGDKFNNGNGSLMRLAPIPLCFHNDELKGMEIAEKQSRTTHNGDQAKECSKLLTLILIRLINRGEQPDWKSVIDKACSDFVNTAHPMKTVLHLAMSEQEPLELYQQQEEQYKRKFTKFNKSPEDRNWNWKDPNFTYSKCRTQDQPGYIGSYCMDALSMALHTVWHSKSFQEIALINANMGGDCDTVGAIAGQLGGAIYGISQYMLHLYGQMEDVKSGRIDVFLKAYKLMTHNPI